MRTPRSLDLARGRRHFIIGLLPFAAAVAAISLHAQDATSTRPAPAPVTRDSGDGSQVEGAALFRTTAPPAMKGPGRIRRRQAAT